MFKVKCRAGRTCPLFWWRDFCWSDRWAWHISSCTAGAGCPRPCPWTGVQSRGNHCSLCVLCVCSCHTSLCHHSAWWGYTQLSPPCTCKQNCFWILLSMTHDRGCLIPKYAQRYNDFGRLWWCIWWSVSSVFALVPVMGRFSRWCLVIPLEAAPGASDKPHHPPVSPGAPLSASSLCEGLRV